MYLLDPAAWVHSACIDRSLCFTTPLHVKLFTGFDPLITDFGYNGNDLDKVTLYRSRYRYGRVRIHCTIRNSTIASVDWFFSNGSKIGATDRNFRAGHHPNGTAMLEIANNRPLSYCDGGTYTCIANTTSDHFETRNITLLINSKLPILYIYK